MCSASKLLNPGSMLPGANNAVVNPASLVTNNSNRLVNPMGSLMGDTKKAPAQTDGSLLTPRRPSTSLLGS